MSLINEACPCTFSLFFSFFLTWEFGNNEKYVFKLHLLVTWSFTQFHYKTLTKKLTCKLVLPHWICLKGLYCTNFEKHSLWWWISFQQQTNMEKVFDEVVCPEELTLKKMDHVTVTVSLLWQNSSPSMI
jgi:hypothetical protein